MVPTSRREHSHASIAAQIRKASEEISLRQRSVSRLPEVSTHRFTSRRIRAGRNAPLDIVDHEVVVVGCFQHRRPQCLVAEPHDALGRKRTLRVLGKHAVEASSRETTEEKGDSLLAGPGKRDRL